MLHPPSLDACINALMLICEEITHPIIYNLSKLSEARRGSQSHVKRQMEPTLFCLLFANLVRTTEVSEVTWKLLGVALFCRLPHSPMQLLLDLLKVHQRLD